MREVFQVPHASKYAPGGGKNNHHTRLKADAVHGHPSTEMTLFY